jgi:hypothetical protein
MDMTADQSALREYAQSVLRHYGVKANRAAWTSATVLALTVDPSAVTKAKSIMPIIEKRAAKFPGLTVVIADPIAAPVVGLA